LPGSAAQAEEPGDRSAIAFSSKRDIDGALTRFGRSAGCGTPNVRTQPQTSTPSGGERNGFRCIRSGSTPSTAAPLAGRALATVGAGRWTRYRRCVAGTPQSRPERQASSSIPTVAAASRCSFTGAAAMPATADWSIPRPSGTPKRRRMTVRRMGVRPLRPRRLPGLLGSRALPHVGAGGAGRFLTEAPPRNAQHIQVAHGAAARRQPL
jgi:hypothetical protein